MTSFHFLNREKNKDDVSAKTVEAAQRRPNKKQMKILKNIIQHSIQQRISH